MKHTIEVVEPVIRSSIGFPLYAIHVESQSLVLFKNPSYGTVIKTNLSVWEEGEVINTHREKVTDESEWKILPKGTVITIKINT